MRKPTVLRKRFIPYEVVDITGDKLLFRSDELLVTKWTSIKPRPDFYGGISYTFLSKGYKLGRFFDKDKNFLYWYFDILDIHYDKVTDTYTLNDLLVDIKVHPDGKVEVLDADELAQALEDGLITQEQAIESLRILDGLLKMIYEGSFPPAQCTEWEY
jgi:predicted RNA-binding protein associated with RNAse of E/G family